MANESKEYGYADSPPQGAHGRTNPPQEKKTQFERPVYDVPPDETKSSQTTYGKMNYAVLTIAGLLVLAIFGTYLYQRGALAPPRPATLHISPVMAVTGDKAAVRIELVRTVDLLSQIELKLVSNPDQLAKVRRLKEDAKLLIESMGE